MAPVTEQEGQGLGDKARRSEDNAEEAEDDADEEEEDEADANAPSHLPLAPHSDSEEICLGIIGNLACHKNLSSTIVSTDGLIQIIVDQLFQDDSACLSETFRLLSVSLQGSSSVTWVEALLKDRILLRILWIIGNTLNLTLLEKSIEFLLTIIQHEEAGAVLLQPLVKFGLPNLVLSLLESEFKQLKENKLERLAVFDLVLQVVEALSTADNCLDLITSNNHIFHPVCEVVKLSHKIEVDSICASAVVILANILVDQHNLVLSISNDFQFLQGLLYVLPLVSNDSTARSALWSILQRVLCQAEENDDGSLDLHRLTLLLLDKHFLIENDIDSHASDDVGGDEGKEFVIASVKRIASILEKWKEKDPSVSEYYDSKAQKLLDYCRKYCF